MDEEFKQKTLELVKEQVTPIKVSRVIIRFVASHSVGFVAATLAKTYCPTENKKQELQLSAGAYVIGHMAGNAAADWAEQELTDAIDFVKSVISKVKDLQAESSTKEEPKLQVIAE